MENYRSGYSNRQVIVILTVIIFPALSTCAEEEFFNQYNGIMSWAKQPLFDGYAISNVFYLSGSRSIIKNRLTANSYPIMFSNTSSMIKIRIDYKIPKQNIKISIFNLQGKKIETEQKFTNAQVNTSSWFCLSKKTFTPGIYFISITKYNHCIFVKKIIIPN